MVDEAVDGGDGHGGVWEDGIPRAERLVGGDQQRAAFVAACDELEDDAGLGLALLDVGEVVQDQQVVFVELLDGGGELEVVAGCLEMLDEIAGAGEQHAVAGIDHGMAEGSAEMGFSGAGRTEQQDVGAPCQPGVALGQGQDARLADGWNGGEVERLDGLAEGQPGFEEMARGSALGTLGDLVLEQGGEGPCGGPALAIGRLGDGGPKAGDGGQAELGQHRRQPGGIDARPGCDLDRGGHGANSAPLCIPAPAISRS